LRGSQLGRSYLQREGEPLHQAWARERSCALRCDDTEPDAPQITSGDPTEAREDAGHVNAAGGPICEADGAAITARDESILDVIRRAWTERRFAWSPEGAGTLVALPQLADRATIRVGDRAVLVNTASTEKYLPTIRRLLGGGLRTKGGPTQNGPDRQAPAAGMRDRLIHAVRSIRSVASGRPTGPPAVR
jgi:threonine synthase